MEQREAQMDRPIRWMAGYRPGAMRGFIKSGEAYLVTPSLPSDSPQNVIRWWEWHLRDAVARYGEDQDRFAQLLAFQNLTVVHDTNFNVPLLKGPEGA